MLSKSLLDIWSLASFRTLPFVAYALASRSTSFRVKVACSIGLAAVLLIDSPLAQPARHLGVVGGLTLAYFCAIACAVHALAQANVVERFGGFALFSLLWATCILGPRLVANGDSASMSLLIGWEVLLGGYSYCVERRPTNTPSRLGDAVFFLLVNPCLAYPEAGFVDPESGRARKGWARCALGIGVWMAQDALGFAIRRSGLDVSKLSIGSAGYLRYLAAGALATTWYYLSHSGLASLRIGMMGALGYRVPESYRFALFARSPRDFWRRWNVWTTSWVRRYIFFPVGIRLRHWLSPVSAVLITFLSVGLLHDSTRIPLTFNSRPAAWPIKGTLIFAAFASLLLMWEGLRRGLRRYVPRRLHDDPRARCAAAAAGALILLHAHIFIYAASLHW